MFEVEVTLRAAAQIERAAAWWEENRLAAPGAILDDFAEAKLLLARQPGIGCPGLLAFQSREGAIVLSNEDAEPRTPGRFSCLRWPFCTASGGSLTVAANPLFKPTASGGG